IPPQQVLVANAGTSIQSLLNGNPGAGTVIEVAAGAQGAITINGAQSGVTIIGAPGLGSSVSGITINGATNVTIQGLHIIGSLTATNTTGLQLIDNQLDSGALTLTGGTGQILLRNHINGTGLSLSGTAGFDIRGNIIASSNTGITIGAG